MEGAAKSNANANAGAKASSAREDDSGKPGE
jgi:hypothetical protein